MDNKTSKKEKKEEVKIIEVSNFNWKLPDCCRELWENCPHGMRKPKRIKKNIAL